jgi:hypothetical protein
MLQNGNLGSSELTLNQDYMDRYWRMEFQPGDQDGDPIYWFTIRLRSGFGSSIQPAQMKGDFLLAYCSKATLGSNGIFGTLK